MIHLNQQPGQQLFVAFVHKLFPLVSNNLYQCLCVCVREGERERERERERVYVSDA